jgi:hypothetical protein
MAINATYEQAGGDGEVAELRDGSLLSRVKHHLDASHVTYREHLTFAVKASGLLAYASVASLMHAFLPALFPATAARIVIGLYKQRLEHHPNPKYQEMLRGGTAPSPQ